jgi:hypothetical protein
MEVMTEGGSDGVLFSGDVEAGVKFVFEGVDFVGVGEDKLLREDAELLFVEIDMLSVGRSLALLFIHFYWYLLLVDLSFQRWVSYIG